MRALEWRLYQNPPDLIVAPSPASNSDSAYSTVIAIKNGAAADIVVR
jgi:hypothetical protein